MKAWNKASRGELVQINQSPPKKNRTNATRGKQITVDQRQYPILRVFTCDANVAVCAAKNEKQYPIDKTGRETNKHSYVLRATF